MPVAEFLPARSTPAPAPEPEPEPEPLVTAEDLAAALGIEAAEATRLAPVVTAMVDAYAPAAPIALRKEGAIRAAGWLAGSPSDNVRGLTAGPFTTDYAPSQRGVLLHSGAKSLLYPYRAKTAGVAR